MAFVRTVPTSELKVGDRVVLSSGDWEVRSVNGDRVELRLGGRTRFLPATEWRVRRSSGPDPRTVGAEFVETPPQVTASGDELITVQEYLRAVGMPDEDLEGSAKTFGSVLMARYRDRHGKTAKPAKKLEYVHYLDINGMDAQEPNDNAPRHLRVRANGWYESNAFEVKDLDLFDQVRAVRHPSLPSLGSVMMDAMAALRELGAVPVEDRAAETVPTGLNLVWLAEQAVQQCLMSGVICGHGECARRRSKQSRRINSANLGEMDWS